jgi:hypothetical protein
MGYYINQTQNGSIGTSFTEKCEALLNAGAVEIEKPKEFIANLVCVVDNVFFGAAAHIYNQDELRDFTMPDDKRLKRFFVWDNVEEFAR